MQNYDGICKLSLVEQLSSPSLMPTEGISKKFFVFRGPRGCEPLNHSDHILCHLLTCDGKPVELWVWVELFTVGLSRDIIPQANGCKGYKTEIERLQKVPVLLKACEDPRRDEEEEQGDDDG